MFKKGAFGKLLFAVLLAGIVDASSVTAAVVITGDPAPPVFSNIGLLRWGLTASEGRLSTVSDPAPGTAPTLLNPTGTPFWVAGTYYSSRMTITGGVLVTLEVDWNGDGIFQVGSEERGISIIPLEANQYVQLHMLGSETGTSNVRNLVINGTSFGNYGPISTTANDVLFKETTGPITDWTITWDSMFGGAPTGANTPDIIFRIGTVPEVVGQPPTEAPEPTSIVMLGLGLVGLGIVRSRRRVGNDQAAAA